MALRRQRVACSKLLAWTSTVQGACGRVSETDWGLRPGVLDSLSWLLGSVCRRAVSCARARHRCFCADSHRQYIEIQATLFQHLCIGAASMGWCHREPGSPSCRVKQLGTLSVVWECAVYASRFNRAMLPCASFMKHAPWPLPFLCCMKLGLRQE